MPFRRPISGIFIVKHIKILVYGKRMQYSNTVYRFGLLKDVYFWHADIRKTFSGSDGIYEHTIGQVFAPTHTISVYTFIG